MDLLDKEYGDYAKSTENPISLDDYLSHVIAGTEGDLLKKKADTATPSDSVESSVPNPETASPETLPSQAPPIEGVPLEDPEKPKPNSASLSPALAERFSSELGSVNPTENAPQAPIVNDAGAFELGVNPATTPIDSIAQYAQSDVSASPFLVSKPKSDLLNIDAKANSEEPSEKKIYEYVEDKDFQKQSKSVLQYISKVSYSNDQLTEMMRQLPVGFGLFDRVKKPSQPQANQTQASQTAQEATKQSVLRPKSFDETEAIKSEPGVDNTVIFTTPKGVFVKNANGDVVPQGLTDIVSEAEDQKFTNEIRKLDYIEDLTQGNITAEFKKGSKISGDAYSAILGRNFEDTLNHADRVLIDYTKSKFNEEREKPLISASDFVKDEEGEKLRQTDIKDLVTRTINTSVGKITIGENGIYGIDVDYKLAKELNEKVPEYNKRNEESNGTINRERHLTIKEKPVGMIDSIRNDYSDANNGKPLTDEELANLDTIEKLTELKNKAEIARALKDDPNADLTDIGKHGIVSQKEIRDAKQVFQLLEQRTEKDFSFDIEFDSKNKAKHQKNLNDEKAMLNNMASHPEALKEFAEYWRVRGKSAFGVNESFFRESTGTQDLRHRLYNDFFSWKKENQIDLAGVISTNMDNAKIKGTLAFKAGNKKQLDSVAETMTALSEKAKQAKARMEQISIDQKAVNDVLGDVNERKLRESQMEAKIQNGEIGANIVKTLVASSIKVNDAIHSPIKGVLRMLNGVMGNDTLDAVLRSTNPKEEYFMSGMRVTKTTMTIDGKDVLDINGTMVAKDKNGVYQAYIPDPTQADKMKVVKTEKEFTMAGTVSSIAGMATDMSVASFTGGVMVRGLKMAAEGAQLWSVKKFADSASKLASVFGAESTTFKQLARLSKLGESSHGVAGWSLQTLSENYNEGKALGMTDLHSAFFASTKSVATGILSTASPDHLLFRSVKSAQEKLAQSLLNGGSKSIISSLGSFLKTITGAVVKNNRNELLQENGEYAVNEIINLVSSSHYGKGKEYKFDLASFLEMNLETLTFTSALGLKSARSNARHENSVEIAGGYFDLRTLDSKQKKVLAAMADNGNGYFNWVIGAVGGNSEAAKKMQKEQAEVNRLWATIPKEGQDALRLYDAEQVISNTAAIEQKTKEISDPKVEEGYKKAHQTAIDQLRAQNVTIISNAIAEKAKNANKKDDTQERADALKKEGFTTNESPDANDTTGGNATNTDGNNSNETTTNEDKSKQEPIITEPTTEAEQPNSTPNENSGTETRSSEDTQDSNAENQDVASGENTSEPSLPLTTPETTEDKSLDDIVNGLYNSDEGSAEVTENPTAESVTTTEQTATDEGVKPESKEDVGLVGESKPAVEGDETHLALKKAYDDTPASPYIQNEGGYAEPEDSPKLIARNALQDYEKRIEADKEASNALESKAEGVTQELPSSEQTSTVEPTTEQQATTDEKETINYKGEVFTKKGDSWFNADGKNVGARKSSTLTKAKAKGDAVAEKESKSPNVETPNVEAPKAEVPKIETPKVESIEPTSPAIESPSTQTTKIDQLKGQLKNIIENRLPALKDRVKKIKDRIELKTKENKGKKQSSDLTADSVNFMIALGSGFGARGEKNDFTKGKIPTRFGELKNLDYAWDKIVHDNGGVEPTGLQIVDLSKNGIVMFIQKNNTFDPRGGSAFSFAIKTNNINELDIENLKKAFNLLQSKINNTSRESIKNYLDSQKSKGKRFDDAMHDILYKLLQEANAEIAKSNDGKKKEVKDTEEIKKLKQDLKENEDLLSSDEKSKKDLEDLIKVEQTVPTIEAEQKTETKSDTKEKPSNDVAPKTTSEESVTKGKSTYVKKDGVWTNKGREIKQQKTIDELDGFWAEQQKLKAESGKHSDDKDSNLSKYAERKVNGRRGVVYLDSKSKKRYTITGYDNGYFTVTEIGNGETRKIEEEGREFQEDFIDITYEAGLEAKGITSESSGIQNSSDYHVTQFEDNVFELKEDSKKDSSDVYRVVLGDAFNHDNAVVTKNGKILKDKRISYSLDMAIINHVDRFNPESKKREIYKFLNSPSDNAEKEIGKPKKEAPKADVKKAETPKVEKPKKEKPKADAPKVEAPKTETPKVETEKPKTETPKVEAPKVETPKLKEKEQAFTDGRMAISEISTDEARFQNRKSLKQHMVDFIAKFWNDAKQDPIVVWRDPKDGKAYVLAGHHRLEGAKKAGRSDVAIRDVSKMYNEAEAIHFAKVESNANRTSEEAFERASAIRNMRDNGATKAEIKEALKLEGKNANFVEALSYLSPDGHVLSELASYANAGDGSSALSQANVAAKKTGEMMKAFPELKPIHEKEIFDYLLSSTGQKRFSNVNKLSDWVSNRMAQGVDENSLLGIETNRTDTAQTDYKERLDAAKAILASHEKTLADLEDRQNNPKNPDYLSTTDKNYKAKQVLLRNLMQEAEDKIFAQKQIIEKIVPPTEKALIDSLFPDFQRAVNGVVKFTKDAMDALAGKLAKAFPNFKGVFTDAKTFDDKMAQFGNPQNMTTKSGDVYGAKFPDGTIYLNPEKLNANTVFHEFGHLFQALAPRTFGKGLGLITESKKGREMIEQARKEGYANPEAEALVQAIGNEGEGIFNGPKLENFKKYVKDMMVRIGTQVGLDKNLLKSIITPDAKFDAFARGVVRDMMKGKPITEQSTGQAISGVDFQKISQAQTIVDVIKKAIADNMVLMEQKGVRKEDKLAQMTAVVKAEIEDSAVYKALNKVQQAEISSKTDLRELSNLGQSITADMQKQASQMGRKIEQSESRAEKAKEKTKSTRERLNEKAKSDRQDARNKLKESKQEVRNKLKEKLNETRERLKNKIAAEKEKAKAQRERASERLGNLRQRTKERLAKKHKNLMDRKKAQLDRKKAEANERAENAKKTADERLEKAKQSLSDFKASVKQDIKDGKDLKENSMKEVVEILNGFKGKLLMSVRERRTLILRTAAVVNATKDNVLAKLDEFERSLDKIKASSDERMGKNAKQEQLHIEHAGNMGVSAFYVIDSHAPAVVTPDKATEANALANKDKAWDEYLQLLTDIKNGHYSFAEYAEVSNDPSLKGAYDDKVESARKGQAYHDGEAKVKRGQERLANATTPKAQLVAQQMINNGLAEMDKSLKRPLKKLDAEELAHAKAKFEKEFDKHLTQETLIDKANEKLDAIRNDNRVQKESWFKKAFTKQNGQYLFDRQAGIKNMLNAIGGKSAIDYLVNVAGASGRAREDFDKAYANIFAPLNKAEKDFLNEIIMLKGIIQADELEDRSVLNPKGFNEVTAQAALDGISKKIYKGLTDGKTLTPEQVADYKAKADNVYKMLEGQAGKYFSEFKKLLKEMKDEGMISDSEYEKMKDRDYVPRKFLFTMFDIEEDADGNITSIKDFEGKPAHESRGISADQIQKLGGGSEASLNIDAQTMLAAAIDSRYKTMAQNRANKELATEAIPRARVRYMALMKKPTADLTKEDLAFIEGFKAMNELVSIPTQLGKSKEYSEVPKGMERAWYFEDGERLPIDLKTNMFEELHNTESNYLGKHAGVISKLSLAPIVTVFATAKNAAFAVSNSIKDSFHLSNYTDHFGGSTTLATVRLLGENVKSIYQYVKGNEDYKAYVKHGGSFDGVRYDETRAMVAKNSMLKFASNVKAGILGDSKAGEKELIDKVFSEKTLSKAYDYFTLSGAAKASEVMGRLSVFRVVSAKGVAEYNQLNGTNYKSAMQMEVAAEAMYESDKLKAELNHRAMMDQVQDLLDNGDTNSASILKKEADSQYVNDMKGASDLRKAAFQIQAKAVQESRSPIDFSQGGKLSKTVNKVSPYFNAQTQGTRGMLNAFASNPIKQSIKLAETMATSSAVIAFGALSLIKFNDDDEKKEDDGFFGYKNAMDTFIKTFEQVSETTKENNFIIPTGKKDPVTGEWSYVKIPAAQSISFATSLSQGLMVDAFRAITGKETHMNEAFATSGRALINNTLGFASLTSQPWFKLGSAYVGFDSFTGKSLNKGERVDEHLSLEGLNDAKVDPFYKKTANALYETFGAEVSAPRMKGMVEAVITNPNSSPTIGVLYALANSATDDKDTETLRDVKNGYLKPFAKRLSGEGSQYEKAMLMEKRNPGQAKAERDELLDNGTAKSKQEATIALREYETTRDKVKYEKDVSKILLNSITANESLAENKRRIESINKVAEPNASLNAIKSAFKKGEEVGIQAIKSQYPNGLSQEESVELFKKGVSIESLLKYQLLISEENKKINKK